MQDESLSREAQDNALLQVCDELVQDLRDIGFSVRDVYAPDTGVYLLALAASSNPNSSFTKEFGCVRDAALFLEGAVVTVRAVLGKMR